MNNFIVRTAWAIVLVAVGFVPDVYAQASHLVIVGGRERVPALARGDDLRIPYWVVIGKMASTGNVIAPTPAECDSARVAFRRTPAAIGKEGGGIERRGQVVGADSLRSWGASNLESFTPAALVTGGDAVFCVAQTELPVVDSSAAQQRVTAEITGRTLSASERDAPYRLFAIVGAGDYSGGGAYAFAPTRYRPQSPRMVIVGRSAGATYGYVGTQPRGTYAVVLGRWNPVAARVEPPTPLECASTTVSFTLLAPKDPGATVAPAEVSALVADSLLAHRLFPGTFASNRSASHQATRRARMVSTESAGPPPDSTSLCVAQAPIRLGDAVGRHLVTARIKRATLGLDVSDVEVMQREQDELSAGQVYFEPIRAHALPRAFVGAMILPGSRESESISDTLQTFLAPAAGLDIPLEPVFGRVLAGLRGTRFPGSMRLVLATPLSDDLGERLYVGLSLQSLIGNWETAGPLDISAGLTFRTKESARPEGFTIGVMLDLGGALGKIASVFGLGS